MDGIFWVRVVQNGTVKVAQIVHNHFCLAERVEPAFDWNHNWQPRDAIEVIKVYHRGEKPPEVKTKRGKFAEAHAS